MKIKIISTKLWTCVLSAASALGFITSATAANINLTGSDGFGSTSFNTGLNWAGGQAPTAGNNYFTAGFLLRTPTAAGNFTFAGDSLTFQPNSTANSTAMNLKGSSGSTITINNCTNAGGVIGNGNGGATYTLAGNMFISAPTAFGLGNDGTRFLIIGSALSGSAAITNGFVGNGLGTITYTNNNTAFTGPMVTILASTNRAASQANLGGNPASFNAQQFVLDSGTFVPTASFAMNNPNSGVTIGAGGGNFNVGTGINFTNANPLAGTGTLTKSGAGTMLQSGSLAGFTGNTTVSAGTLAIGASGSLSGSPVISVSGGATLDVSAGGLTMSANQQLTGGGTILGSVTDATGCTINADGPGGAVTNLTFNNNLNLVNGGTIAVDFSATTNDVLIVNGNLNPSGVTYVTVVTAPPGGFVNGTSYTIMKVNGTLGGTAANFAVPATLQTRQTFPITYDTVNKLVKLTVAGNQPASLVWQGDFVNGSANAWDVNTTTNWLNNGIPDYYFDLDAVSFTDVGTNQSGTINQPTLDITVNPKSVTFNATNNYTLSSLTGLGVIAGTGGLTVKGSGSVTIQTTNTYTGGTLVSGGILSANNTGALGNPVNGILVAVTNGGSFDISGQGFTATQYILASGSGVATNIGAIFASSGMGCAIGCAPKGFRNLRLSANAVIGEDGAIWQIGSDGNANGGSGVGSIDGKGFSLTKVGNNQLVLEANNVSALSSFVLANGGLQIANTSGGNPFGATATLVISNGAWADSWDNYANSGITLANPITIGAGGGRLQNTHGMYYNHACYNTFSGNVTLSPDTNANSGLTILDTSSYGGGPNNVPTWGTMTFSGVISGTNNVVVAGPLSQYSSANNPVNFTGNNTYSGLTIVSNYVTLNTTTYNQSGGAYDIVDFGDLDVVSVSGRPTLPMSSLLLDVQLLGAPSIGFSRLTSMPTSPLIYATNLTITSSCDIVPPKSGYSIGQFPLIKYDGSIGGAGFAGLTMNTLPRGVAGTLVDNSANHTIDLQVTAIGMVWTGTNSSDWDIGLTQNWYNPQALTPDYYYEGDTVVFNDASTNYFVNIPATVKPTGITVNTTNTYTFNGTAGISGAASLLKTGSGTLIVANTNSFFTGGTYITGGTLRVADGNNTYPYNGGALNDNLGNVTVSAGGTLDVNGIQVPNYQSFGPDGYNVYISGAGVTNGGALVNNNTSNNDNADPGYLTLTGDATVGGTGDVNVRHGVAPKLSSQSGAYTLTKVGPGQFRVRYLTEVSTNFGNINILQGIVSFESSTTNGFGDPTKKIFVGNGAGFALGTASKAFNKQMICSNGATVYGYNTTGNVFASPVALDSGTITLNANYFNAMTFSNVLSGAGGISVTYNSTVTFAASNTYSGNTYVADCNASPGSVLRLAGNGSIANSPNITLQGITTGQAFAGGLDASARTDGTLTLLNSQTLRGDNGSYVKGNVVATSGTTITPGGLNNVQSMNFSNNFTLQAGSTFVADVAYDGVSVTSNDVANVTGTLSYGGTLTVNAIGSPLVAGNSFKLFNTTGTPSGSFAITNLPALATGLGWNWNPATATLSVVATVNTDPATANFQAVLTGGGSALHFTWASDHQGWQLYTNAIGLGATGSWFPVLGSGSVTSETMPVNPAAPHVFFQLRYP